MTEQETNNECAQRIQALLDEQAPNISEGLYLELSNLLKRQYEESIHQKHKAIILELLDDLVGKTGFNCVQDIFNFLIEYKTQIETCINLIELDEPYTVMNFLVEEQRRTD
jgi:hypothetical protein